MRVWRLVLVATGFWRAAILIVAGAIMALVWRDGTISDVGPIHLQPELHTIVAVPMILAVACGISHTTMRSAALHASARTRLARGISHATAAGLGVSVLAVGDLVSTADVWGGAVRNLALLAGVALAVAGLAGPEYAWIPVIGLFGAAVLSPGGDSPLSPAQLLGATATPGQVAVACAVFVLGFALAVWDPDHRGYLPRYR